MPSTARAYGPVAPMPGDGTLSVVSVGASPGRTGRPVADLVSRGSRSRQPGARSRTIPVDVVAGDGLSRAGVAALLSGHARVELLHDGAVTAPGVVILVADRLSSGVLQTLKLRQERLRQPRVDDRSGPGGPAVLAVTDELADEDLLAALDAGVCGVIRRRDAGRSQLISAAISLAEGKVLLPPRHQALLVEHLRRVRYDILDPNGLTLSGLTARERDVLRLVADGLDTEQIAVTLAFSPRTVKYVLTHVMNRYGLRSRAHAVAYAVRVGAI